MRTPRHLTCDEMDSLMRQARIERSQALFALCARLRSWMTGREAAPVSPRFA